MSWHTYNEETKKLLGLLADNEVAAFIDAVMEAYRNDSFVFVIGNGGSAANASHLAEDLAKGILSGAEGQKRLRVISLTDNTSFISAIANDVAYDAVFVEQLKNFAHKKALLIAISGSGNSPNILRAVEYANHNGMKTFGVTGYDGGALRRMAGQSLLVPSFNMGMVEAIHGVIFHYVTDVLKDLLDDSSEEETASASGTSPQESMEEANG